MKKSNLFKGFLALGLIFISDAIFAQTGGAGAITQATSDIEGYVEPVGKLTQAIGAVVGVIGGIRIYNKWNNGDQDINKELVGWGGACIFLILVPTIITAFFGL